MRRGRHRLQQQWRPIIYRVILYNEANLLKDIASTYNIYHLKKKAIIILTPDQWDKAKMMLMICTELPLNNA